MCTVIFTTLHAFSVPPPADSVLVSTRGRAHWGKEGEFLFLPVCFAQHLSKNWARERQSNSAYDKSWAVTSCIPHAQCSLCSAAFSVSPLAGLFLVSTRGRTCAGERGECPLTPGMFCSAYKQKLGTQQRHNVGTAVQRASACAL